MNFDTSGLWKFLWTSFKIKLILVPSLVLGYSIFEVIAQPTSLIAAWIGAALCAWGFMHVIAAVTASSELKIKHLIWMDALLGIVMLAMAAKSFQNFGFLIQAIIAFAILQMVSFFIFLMPMLLAFGYQKFPNQIFPLLEKSYMSFVYLVAGVAFGVLMAINSPGLFGLLKITNIPALILVQMAYGLISGFLIYLVYYGLKKYLFPRSGHDRKNPN